MSVILRGHCERSEAIQFFDRTGTLDCFVAEPVIGPRFARTRWLLAMTTEPSLAGLGVLDVELAEFAGNHEVIVVEHEFS